ncbi:MAG: tetratricopeptide repeat protein [Chloroherpetonaceae bacterium]|nr:tetratricopeptide repeat protein [Chloroherpetonaceae bacterium]
MQVNSIEINRRKGFGIVFMYLVIFVFSQIGCNEEKKAITPRRESDSIFSVAMRHEFKSDYDSALTSYQQLLQRDSTSQIAGMALLRSGDIHQRFGRWEKAEEAFGKTIYFSEIRPMSLWARASLIFRIRPTQVPDSLINELIYNSTMNDTAQFILGKAYYLKEKYVESEKSFSAIRDVRQLIYLRALIYQILIAQRQQNQSAFNKYVSAFKAGCTGQSLQTVFLNRQDAFYQQINEIVEEGSEIAQIRESLISLVRYAKGAGAGEYKPYQAWFELYEETLTRTQTADSKRAQMVFEKNNFEIGVLMSLINSGLNSSYNTEERIRFLIEALKIEEEYRGFPLPLLFRNQVERAHQILPELLIEKAQQLESFEIAERIKMVKLRQSITNNLPYKIRLESKNSIPGVDELVSFIKQEERLSHLVRLEQESFLIEDDRDREVKLTALQPTIDQERNAYFEQLNKIKNITLSLGEVLLPTPMTVARLKSNLEADEIYIDFYFGDKRSRAILISKNSIEIYPLEITKKRLNDLLESVTWEDISSRTFQLKSNRHPEAHLRLNNLFQKIIQRVEKEKRLIYSTNVMIQIGLFGSNDFLQYKMPISFVNSAAQVSEEFRPISGSPIMIISEDKVESSFPMILILKQRVILEMDVKYIRNESKNEPSFVRGYSPNRFETVGRVSELFYEQLPAARKNESRDWFNYLSFGN